LNQTVLTTVRPLDLFARNFLHYLEDYCYVQYEIRVETDRYLDNVKVFNCTDRFWHWLLDLRATKMAVGDPNEYHQTPQRDSIDGLSIPPVGIHRITGQRYFIPPDGREEWHRNTFPAPLAHRFAEYAALIFLYRPERWAQQLQPKMFPQTTPEQFTAAKTYTVKHAAYRACAHECLHLVQKVAGGTMPEWDPATDLDPVERLYEEYLDQITHPIFQALYLHDQPQADIIDL
jgi:hypothetical protein